jgi:squalene-hopene/tetraprenyl-beta-curcumene cyclase
LLAASRLRDAASGIFGAIMRLTLLALLFAAPALADTPKPALTRPDEPVAKMFSAAKAAEFIDGASLHWTRERKCFACHTNVFYMAARPRIAGGDEAPLKEMREFLEKDVAGWEQKPPRADYFVLANAMALAGHDAATTGKLHPMTRKALDRSLTLQLADGTWKWPACDWPPLEHDQWFGVVFMAIAYGTAPEDYAKQEHVQPTLAKIRAYVKKTPPPDLHHKLALAWASTKIDGLMTEDERRAAAKELLAKQRPDGGWCLPAIGDYPKRRDGSPNDADAPSDGYATGYSVFVLRQLGIKADDPALQKAVKWLKANQRESGRWFTRSLQVDRTNANAHLITNAGSAFCVLALHACGEPLKD